VTALGSGAPDRESTSDAAPRRGIGRQIAILLAIGLVFRLILAYGIDGLRGSGFGADLGLFNYWADTLREFGPWGFYANASYADYTPGYLYALWPIGYLREAAAGLGLAQDVVDSLIKLPAIITDLAMAYLVASMALELGVSRRRALFAAAIVVVNPITWFDSVIWGQVDSFGTVFLMLGVRELWRGRHERAAVIAVVAALVKPQLAILVPIVAVVAIRRALWPKGGYGDEEAPRRRGFAWEHRDIGWKRIVTTGVAGFVTAVALSAPFGLTVIGVSTEAPFLTSTLLRLVFSTAATYPYLSVNAYNWWALFPVDGQSVASAGGALWMPDSPVNPGEAFGAIGPIPAGLVGAALLLGTAAVVAWIVARRPDRLTILVGVSVLALAFFAAPTRVHERYLFPFFGLAGILFAVSTRWKAAYVVAGIATFLNMYVVLVALYPDNPGVSDWLGIGGAIRSTFGVTVVALMHSAAFIWGVMQLRPSARRALAAELEGAWMDEDQVRPAAAVIPGTSRRQAGGSAAGAVGSGAGPVVGAPAAGSAVAAAAPRLVPAWYDRPSWTEMGPIAWLRARVSETPFRPDRSASLVRERRGRLDRVDLWLLIVLVVAAMFLRTYRLAEPARMHFDEVYHARTAAEFLQFWRYGISHNIYEWTHPHLAKYAMAGGITAFAGHDVARSGDLGVPVRDATLEPRREDLSGGGDRAGDRTWVATGTELVAYDQLTRRVEARWALPGASAVTFDDVTNQLLVGTDAGELLAIDTTALDATRGADPASPAISPAMVATVEGPVTHLAGFDDGSHVAALLAGGTVAVVDLDTGEVSGTALVAGPTSLASVGDLNAVMVVPENATDPAGAAARLVEILGGDAASYEAALSGATPGPFPLPDVVPDIEARRLIKTAIDAGELPGIELAPTSTMAVGGTDGVTFIDTAARPFALVELDGVGGMAQVTGVDDGAQLYASTVDATTGSPEMSIIALSGERADDGPEQMEDFPLPAAGTDVVFDVAAELVEVLGSTPDGTGTTVYVVEPHGRSVFADHQLPFSPAALVLDHNKDWPAVSHGTLLALGAGGEAASLDVGSYHFSWRLPGVILGALTVAVLFLLGRLLFSRRAVGVLVGLFVLLDGMFFVQSRIAMNDVYTAFFILSAYLLFAWMWLEPEKVKRAFWIVMPAMGVLLGLALASKWVAAYAIGALGILVLVRSALGRILLIGGLILITAVLGWMAYAVSGNLPFILLMIGLTLATVVVSVYHPVAWADDEVRFAVGAPAALGIVIAGGAVALGRAQEAVVLGPVSLTPLEAGFGLVVVGIAAYAAFMIGGRLGIGPMAPSPDPGAPDGPPPASPAPEGWVRLGWGLGLPVVWLAGSLLVIPIVVYVALYLPWAFLENHQLVAGWPVNHTGQTLIELTEAMYRYHNELTAAHAASSPWWAWPLNLKPVWFYQGSYAGGTSAAIYDAGNIVTWWLGIPAMLFVAYQAFRRRSLALALVLIAFLAQWVSWARIDRAAFGYHYYTSLPFVLLALGYFIGEVWHGASKRTWLLVRASAAVAMMGPVILWLLRYPLCGLAAVESVNAGSQACNGNPGNLVVTPATAAMVVVAIGTVIVLVWQLVGLGRGRQGGGSSGRSAATRDLLPIVLTAGTGGVLLAVSRLLPDADPLFTFNGIVPELIALIVAVPLGLIALQILVARDARRFVGGLVAAVAAWFVLLYPNIAALAMPSTIVNAYQGLLPTYLYAFQFGVTKVDRGGAISFSDPTFFILLAFLVVASGIIAYSSWAWRQALAPGGGEAPGAGSAGAGSAGDAGSAGAGSAGPGTETAGA
jgi:hypothetical protein